jgi:hypothetical protein
MEDLTTVFFNPLERPLKNVSIGNSEAKTNLTTKQSLNLALAQWPMASEN